MSARPDDVAARIAQLVCVRGDRRAVDDVTVEVRRGVVTGLLGPSGCGKSTLMRAIVGVQIVHGGSVHVLGLPAGAPELRRRVAYVTQAPSVYLDLTVGENLRYFAALVGAPARRVGEAVALVGLERELRRRAQDLSGGERSRASLAVALLGEPELLVLDEPTVGVDPILRRELWETFHRLAGAGTTIVISSHVMDEASRCRDLVLMRNGRLVAAGTPAELRARAGTEDLEDAFVRLAAAE